MAVTYDNLTQIRLSVEEEQLHIQSLNAKVLETAKKQCTIYSFQLEVAKKIFIKVNVIKPKDVQRGNVAAYIYAHGGGAIFLNADMNNSLMCHSAINLGCIIFNVDYRKGPENKAPVGQEDFAKAVEHIYDNSEKYGINKYQMCMAGISGGGWVCLGASNLLVK